MIDMDEERLHFLGRWKFLQRVARRVARFKDYQSLACRFVNVGAVIAYHADSQADPEKREKLRSEKCRGFVDSIKEGFFERDGPKRLKPQILLLPDNANPSLVGRESFAQIEAYPKDVIESHYIANFWLPIDAARRWSADQRMDFKEEWLRAAQQIASARIARDERRAAQPPNLELLLRQEKDKKGAPLTTREAEKIASHHGAIENQKKVRDILVAVQGKQKQGPRGSRKARKNCVTG